MSDKIVQIGFHLIKDNFENGGLEENFLIYDNFSEGSNVLEWMTVTDYPIRLNAITIIAYCVEGHIKFNLGMKKRTLSKNQVFVLLPDQMVQTTEITPDFKACFTMMRREFLHSQNHFLETINLHNTIMEQPHFDLSEKEMQEYLQLFKMMQEKRADRENIYYQQIMQNYFQITFYNLYNLIIRQKNLPEQRVISHNMAIYERFIKCVEKNYRKEHSVQFYANQICLTPKYLSTLVDEISGKHASDWIHEYIIFEAKALLKSTNMSLQAISDVLCFCTPSHFGRFFKRYTGYTPSEYKRCK